MLFVIGCEITVVGTLKLGVVFCSWHYQTKAIPREDAESFKGIRFPPPLAVHITKHHPGPPRVVFCNFLNQQGIPSGSLGNASDGELWHAWCFSFKNRGVNV